MIGSAKIHASDKNVEHSLFSRASLFVFIEKCNMISNLRAKPWNLRASNG